MLQELNLKQNFITDEREELDQVNEDLTYKLKTLTLKLESSKQQHALSENLMKQKLDELKA